MTVREIRGHLEELYGIDVSPDLISTVTDAVLDEVAEWQNRPLDVCFPLVFFDAIRVKIRDEGFVRNKAVYIALGILPDGTKEILGLWIEQTEGAKFWLIPRVPGFDPFDRSYLARMPGAVGAAVRLPQAKRNAAGGPNNPAFGGAIRAFGGVAALARYRASRRARRLPEGPGLPPSNGSNPGTLGIRVINELKNRGLQDILIAVVDGLKGFAEAINAVFPETVIQTCIVHLIRHSMNFASWKDRKHVAKALRALYRAADSRAGQAALDEFAEGPWGEKYPAITLSWRRNWDLVIPFFAFPESVRRIIYTTNAIEALNSKLRRAVRTRGHFPSDDAASKLLYFVLNHAAADWKRPPREWFEAKTQFAVMFGERFVNQ